MESGIVNSHERRFDQFLALEAWLAGDINEMRRLLGQAAVDESAAALTQAAQIGLDALEALLASAALKSLLRQHYNNSVRRRSGRELTLQLRQNMALLLSFLEMERRLLHRTGLSEAACNAIVGDCRRAIEGDVALNTTEGPEENAETYVANIVSTIARQRDTTDRLLADLRQQENAHDFVERGWFRHARQVLTTHGGILVFALNYGADSALHLNQAAMAVSGSAGLGVWLTTHAHQDHSGPRPHRRP